MRYIKPRYATINVYAHLFLSPWIVMLILGTLGHHLHVPADSILYKFGYWDTFLAILGIQFASPEYQTEYEVEDEDDN